MIDEAVEDKLRDIISHLLLGEKESISKEGFDLIIIKLKEAITKEIEKVKINAYKTGWGEGFVSLRNGHTLEQDWQQYKKTLDE